MCARFFGLLLLVFSVQGARNPEVLQNVSPHLLRNRAVGNNAAGKTQEAPTNLRFSVVNDVNMKFEWTPPKTWLGDGKRYLVHIKSGDKDAKHILNDPYYFAIGLKPWSKYTVQVFAESFVKSESVKSTALEGSVTTEVKEPSLPRNFTVTDLKSTSFSVTWVEPAEPNGPITKYDVHLVAMNSFFLITQSFKQIPGSVRFQNLGVWNKYMVFVTAYNTRKDGTILNGASAYIEPTTEVEKPSTCSEFRVVKHLNSSSITLEWTKPDKPNGPIDGYTFTVIDDQLKKAHTQDIGKNAVTVVNLAPYTKYTFKVAAFNFLLAQDGNLTSDFAEVKDTTDPGAPSVPTDVSVEAVTATSIRVRWRVPTDPRGPISGYLVLCVGCSSKGKLTKVPATQREYKFEIQKPWSSFTVSVRAFNTQVKTGNQYIPGKEVRKTGRTPPSKPSAPRDLVAMNVRAVDFEVKWTEPEARNGPISGYTAVCGTKKIDVAEQDAIVRFAGLKPLTNYNVSLSAFNMFGDVRLEGPTATILVKTSEGQSVKVSIFTLLVALSLVPFLS